MKYICIESSERLNNIYIPLTSGKVYESIDTSPRDSNGFICIKNDIGVIGFYYASMFKSLNEWREDKLNKIGI